MLTAGGSSPTSSIATPYASSTNLAASAVPGLSLELKNVRQTEFYNGFMRSSAKITIYLGHPATASPRNSLTTSRSPNELGGVPGPGGGGSWTCAVCGFRNEAGNSKCELCGVGRDRSEGIESSRPTTPKPPAPILSSPPAISTQSGNGAGKPSGNPGKIECPACTFLNHRSMVSCEICGTSLPGAGASSAAPTLLNGSAGRNQAVQAANDDSTGKLDVVRLSFRKGGEKVAYAKLKSVLSQKGWEKAAIARQPMENGEHPRAATPRAGIDGILQTISLEAQSNTDHLSTAFADLEILMVRAGEMVKLAQSLNDKLTAQQRTTPGGKLDKAKEEEATLIRTSLVQLGLPAPALTSDMVRSDHEYFGGLARELGALLTGTGWAGDSRSRPAGAVGGSQQGEVDGLMVGKNGRGVIGLDEVWGLWMRARGVALLSPSTLLSILPFLANHTSPPIRSHSLPSGLLVLYSPTYSTAAIRARLLRLLEPLIPSTRDSVDGSNSIQNGEAGEQSDEGKESSLSLIEIAGYEGLAIGLAKELVQEVEQDKDRSPFTGFTPLRHNTAGPKQISGLVRDEQAEQAAGGVRWYRDLISVWSFEAQ